MVFHFKVSFKRKHKLCLKKIGFKLTKKKVMEITSKQKRFLEFQDHWDQAPYTKTELWSLESFPHIRDLTYS